MKKGAIKFGCERKAYRSIAKNSTAVGKEAKREKKAKR
jgi:hypothetical protein